MGRSSTVDGRRSVLLHGPLPLLLSSLRPRPRRTPSGSLLRRRVTPTSSTSVRQRPRSSSVPSHVLLLLLLHGSKLRGNELVSLELPPAVSTAETRPSRDRPSDELPARTSRFVEGEEEGVFVFAPRQTLGETWIEHLFPPLRTLIVLPPRDHLSDLKPNGS